MRRPRLVTIAVSHYCEKARWALDRAGVEYDEEDHVPVLHLVGLRGRTTPILHEAGRTLGDSTDILLALETRTSEPLRLVPSDPEERAAALALEERLDEELGPVVRRVAYFHLIGAPREFAGAIAARGRPWQRTIARAAPRAIAAVLARAFRLERGSIARAEAKLLALVDEVSASAKGPWLIGERFTIADLTLAALIAPLLAPPEHPVGYPSADRISPEIRALRDRIAATRAGEIALRAYREERARGAGFEGRGTDRRGG